mmetsp:Transcript_18521/g.37617  ORF Transcript_18521/g.37617 Transcript_18521/m.37617 type:complete len:1118 (-) Transcript_18521:723-4076(-)
MDRNFKTIPVNNDDGPNGPTKERAEPETFECEEHDDDEVEHNIDDHQPDPDARTKTIFILPNGDRIKGTGPEATLYKWHRTAGHINDQFLHRVAPNCDGMEELVNIPKRTCHPSCDACKRGKAKRHTPLKTKPSHRYREVLYRMHADLSGIIQTPTLGGARYFVVFVDDASRYRFVALLKKKSDFITAFDQLTTRLGRHPKVIRTDNAKEMSVHGSEAKEYYNKFKIFNELCAPHEHDQNPVAEAIIGSLSFRARTLLIHANAPRFMWGLSVLYAAELENRFCPFMKGSDKTCHEAFYGTRPDNDFIADTEWGCRAYLHIDKKRRNDGKWDETALPLIYVGTARHLGYKAYILSNKDGSRQYIARHNVTFDRTAFPWRKAEIPDEPRDPMQLDANGNIKKIFDNDGQRITLADAEGPGPELRGDGTSVTNPTLVINTDVEEERQANLQPPERTRTRSMARAIETEADQERQRRREIDPLRSATDQDRRSAARQLPSKPQGVWDELARAADDFLQSVEEHVQDRGDKGDRGARPLDDTDAQALHACSHHCSFTYRNRRAPAHDNNVHAYRAWLRPAKRLTPDIGGKSEAMLHSFLSTSGEPKSIAEANDRDDREEWWAATMEEFESWNVLEVFEPIDECDVPADAEIIDSRVVFKLKLDEYNIPFRYKCRIVARGDQQTDDEDTFAPMAHPIVIRMLISIAVANGWDIKQSDCKTAYLNAMLPKPVYLRPPKGLEHMLGKGRVMRLKRAVYGLGTSGRLWYQLFTKKNKDFGMTAITDDDCCFYRKRGDSILICVIVVDDVLQITNDENLRLEWLSYMRDFFKVSDDGPLKWYLGVNYIRQANGDVLASQKAYLTRCLERYKLTNVKPQTSPMKHGFQIDIDSLPAEPDPKHVAEFRAKIGSLIFLYVWTRPDIAFAVNYLARFTLRANRECIAAADHVFAYLKHTENKGIWFKRNPTNPEGRNVLTAFADTSDNDCKMTSKSTGGYVIMINGAPVAWKSGRLPLVTLSSAESEYVELTLASQEIINLRDVLMLLGIEQNATVIYEDNQAAIAICNNPCHRSRTRHIRRRYHFIRQCVRDGDIFVTYVQSADNIADIMTKPTPEPLHREQTRRVLNEL